MYFKKVISNVGLKPCKALKEGAFQQAFLRFCYSPYMAKYKPVVMAWFKNGFRIAWGNVRDILTFFLSASITRTSVL
ncbi:MAG: hypothetical protein ACJA2D_002441 [Pseudohongiellaceae bacterium]